jgi:hypothetical protein
MNIYNSIHVSILVDFHVEYFFHTRFSFTSLFILFTKLIIIENSHDNFFISRTPTNAIYFLSCYNLKKETGTAV